ncbi:redoxin domain-containing protein [Puniceicoccaceae bacterium K14]|nr:redoxin domain-containing protein [Puniceicoccaceae bacterium K14]
MAKIGEKLNLDFTVKAAVDGEKRELLFSELIDARTIVSVYMKNNTKSCDLQVASLVAHADKISDFGVKIVVVSKDTVGSHCRYAEKQGANFVFVSDPEYGFATAVGSLVEKKMYGKTFVGPTRSAYLIDESGKLLADIEKVDSPNHGQQIVDLIKSL